jgi:hypothetical protein
MYVRPKGMRALRCYFCARVRPVRWVVCGCEILPPFQCSHQDAVTCPMHAVVRRDGMRCACVRGRRIRDWAGSGRLERLQRGCLLACSQVVCARPAEPSRLVYSHLNPPRSSRWATGDGEGCVPAPQENSNRQTRNVRYRRRARRCRTRTVWTGTCGSSNTGVRTDTCPCTCWAGFGPPHRARAPAASNGNRDMGCHRHSGQCATVSDFWVENQTDRNPMSFREIITLASFLGCIWTVNSSTRESEKVPGGDQP